MILERKSSKTNNYEQGKSEIEQICKNNLKNDSPEQEESEKERIGKGTI